jgi:hypothetical protein
MSKVIDPNQVITLHGTMEGSSVSPTRSPAGRLSMSSSFTRSDHHRKTIMNPGTSITEVREISATESSELDRV